MNDKPTETSRHFVHFNRAWYAEANRRMGFDHVDDISLCDDRQSGEVVIRWYTLNNKPVPKLEAFDDSWRLLGLFQDVLTALAKHDDENITPEAVCALLAGLGFEDRTPTVNPHVTQTETDILDTLQKGAIPAWAAEHFKDYAKKAIENLIERGLAERKPDGSIAAK